MFFLEIIVMELPVSINALMYAERKLDDFNLMSTQGCIELQPYELNVLLLIYGSSAKHVAPALSENPTDRRRRGFPSVRHR